MRGIVLVFILCWYDFPVSEARDKCTHYAAIGNNFSIPLDHPNLKKDDELIWKNISDTVYKRKRNIVYINKTVVNEQGSLQIIDVKITDAASYSVEVFEKDGIFKQKEEKHLCVFETILLKPQIQQSVCSQPKVTLTCSVENPKHVNYDWYKNKKIWKRNTSTLSEDQHIFKSSDTFSCNVSNKVSYQISNDFKINCPGNKLFGLDFWVMVAILATGGGLILILMLVLVVCVCRRQKQNKYRKQDEEELRLASMMQQAHPPRPQEAPRGHAAPCTHLQNGEDYTPAPPRPRAKRPRPPPVPVVDEEKPPPRPKPRQSMPRHNRS